MLRISGVLLSFSLVSQQDIRYYLPLVCSRKGNHEVKITYNGIPRSGVRVLKGGRRIEVFVTNDDAKPEAIVLLYRFIEPDGSSTSIVKETFLLDDPIWDEVNVLNFQGVLHPMSKPQKGRIATQFISQVACRHDSLEVPS